MPRRPRDTQAASECGTEIRLPPPPLVVDLDGTLIHTDMLHEHALRLLRDRPLDVLRIPAWLSQGKAALKQRLARLIQVDPALLPYNEPLLAWLRDQRRAGRTLVLCTASDRTVADAIAAHLGLFDDVIASDGVTNLAGAHKAEHLVSRFGAQGFDYAGNSHADLAVWAKARHAIVVGASAGLLARARAVATVEWALPPQPAGPAFWRRALRIHQWMKNLLLFVPLFASHEIGRLDDWQALGMAFLAFSLCASSVYIANDLFDLESDRLHPRKRGRPFAAGLLPAWQGVLAAPLLLALGLSIGWLVGEAFLVRLAIYFLLTCAYSWFFKRQVLVDCVVLALLYTMRIVAGAAAVSVEPSFWLLSFSVFLFLSLAFVKRYAELAVQAQIGRDGAHGRGYRTTDLGLVQTMGVGAAYAAVMVLALYLNSDSVVRLYRTPAAIWGAVLVMLFWVNWMWLQTHRGRMDDDPLVFAVKDPTSLVSGALFAAAMAAGSLPLG